MHEMNCELKACKKCCVQNFAKTYFQWAMKNTVHQHHFKTFATENSLISFFLLNPRLVLFFLVFIVVILVSIMEKVAKEMFMIFMWMYNNWKVCYVVKISNDIALTPILSIFKSAPYLVLSSVYCFCEIDKVEAFNARLVLAPGNHIDTCAYWWDYRLFEIELEINIKHRLNSIDFS